MPAPDYLKTWSNELEADAVRLVAFQRWLAGELGGRLVWPKDHARATRQIGQARAFVERAVSDLAKRGWLFRPVDLTKLIVDQLEHVAAYQRADKVHDIYKYLERAWDNWAGRKAEELAIAAQQLGVHRAHMPRPLPPSIAEITLQNLEARDAEIRAGRTLRRRSKVARKGACNAPAEPLLPGFSGG